MLFKHKTIEKEVNLNIYFSKEWQEALKPLFKTDYFSALMLYIESLYPDNDSNKLNKNTNHYPEKLKNIIFNPFLLTVPKDIKVVYIHSNIHPSDKANGIGFGTVGSPRNLTHSKHEELFSEIQGVPQILDETLISWLKQGVLVLNKRPILDRQIPTLHDNIFDYFYLNVLKYLSLLNEDLIIGSNNLSSKNLVDIFIKDNKNITEFHTEGYFPKSGASIYEKINTQLLINGNRQIRWSKSA